ncbi:starch branching enzyme [Chloropicon primus]|uniref:1,4-alpha-glucan branching enzyme n=1 Tax=Chloropicon primus TaxID=1764295 RepID=A0A5B8MFN9_9CHLO|nr:starch branching enzyme [Chloropicon primus]UPQ98405.1 starch branching enzyme [Chloropicon primus]|eukprot:QDZ19197.1 starch branching enzyme [Chloropicon primus]
MLRWIGLVPRATPGGEGSEKLKVYDIDPMLGKFEDHLEYRYRRYLEQLRAIEESDGSLEAFSSGYDRMGFFVEGGKLAYREWAPAAQQVQLIGDFNDWSGWDLEREAFGTWKLILGDEGESPVPHGSRVKVRIQTPHGNWVDRIPAWITYATVDANTFGAAYDGVFWNPPESARHEFQNARPKPTPSALRIYEAHVGMSGQEPRVSTYKEFADDILPRIKASNYNAVQLMAIQEHSYYASFGYHVTNAFAVSSRSGNPEDLKYLIDKAHGMGIVVIMDLVHSHASNNSNDGLNGFDFGQKEDDNYFLSGEAGYHQQWDSRLFNYRNWEVLRYLLSNVRWWLEEYNFDGFRFDGVTSMLYHHHGINTGFSGNYEEYFGLSTNVDAVVYLMLANKLIHDLVDGGISVAEDVSGMPTLCREVGEGGVGFDYRLAMGVPDKWIQIIKHVPFEDWSMGDLVSALCNRRYSEKTISYSESHDQSIVGDQTIAFRLMGAEMYTGMSALEEASEVIERGIALHKMIRTITMAIGGEGWLNFMGNEFGHPEWIDFPREGNGWSYDKCRRRWDLADATHLRYKSLLDFDAALEKLEEDFRFLCSPHQLVSEANEAKKVIVAERGALVFVFNFHWREAYEGHKIGVGMPGKYTLALDSDADNFGGRGRVYHDAEYFTTPEEGGFNGRPCSMQIYSPPRTVLVFSRVDE